MSTRINEYQRTKDAHMNSLTACTSNCLKLLSGEILLGALLLGALYYLEHVRSFISATRLMCSGPGEKQSVPSTKGSISHMQHRHIVLGPYRRLKSEGSDGALPEWTPKAKAKAVMMLMSTFKE